MLLILETPFFTGSVPWLCLVLHLQLHKTSPCPLVASSGYIWTPGEPELRRSLVCLAAATNSVLLFPRLSVTVFQIQIVCCQSTCSWLSEQNSNANYPSQEYLKHHILESSLLRDIHAPISFKLRQRKHSRNTAAKPNKMVNCENHEGQRRPSLKMLCKKNEGVIAPHKQQEFQTALFIKVFIFSLAVHFIKPSPQGCLPLCISSQPRFSSCLWMGCDNACALLWHCPQHGVPSSVSRKCFLP